MQKKREHLECGHNTKDSIHVVTYSCTHIPPSSTSASCYRSQCTFLSCTCSHDRLHSLVITTQLMAVSPVSKASFLHPPRGTALATRSPKQQGLLHPMVTIMTKRPLPPSQSTLTLLTSNCTDLASSERSSCGKRGVHRLANKEDIPTPRQPKPFMPRRALGCM